MRSARRGSLPTSRLNLVCSVWASVSEKVASNTRASGWVRARWTDAVQCHDGLARARGSGDARRAGVVALHPLPLLRVQEDRPLLPREIEGALQLLDVGHYAEATLGVGMVERIGDRSPTAAPCVVGRRWRALSGLRPLPPGRRSASISRPSSSAARTSPSHSAGTP